MHPAPVSAELDHAPNAQVLAPWKGVERRATAMQRVREFLIRHEPTTERAKP